MDGDNVFDCLMFPHHLLVMAFALAGSLGADLSLQELEDLQTPPRELALEHFDVVFQKDGINRIFLTAPPFLRSPSSTRLGFEIRLKLIVDFAEIASLDLSF